MILIIFAFNECSFHYCTTLWRIKKNEENIGSAFIAPFVGTPKNNCIKAKREI